MAFTEFTVRSGGSNMNGGRLNSNGEAATTAVYSATNGGWNSGTGVFTPTSGDPSASVTVGDFAHVFTDGSTTPTRIARVTAVNTTTVTLSTTIGVGTAPTTAGTGISINVGGAWSGPSGAVGFPFTLVTGALVDSSSNQTRVNFKDDQTYTVSATVSGVNTGSGCIFQGYTSTFGDGGKATYTGGTTGASFVTLQLQNNDCSSIVDFIFDSNGATGSADGLTPIRGSIFRNCIFRNMRGSGIGGGFGTTLCFFIECEFYGNNASNTSGKGGASPQTPSAFLRCYSHNNTGSNSSGLMLNNTASSAVDCVVTNNGGPGILIGSTGQCALIRGCDIYNNSGNGITINNTTMVYVENSNFVKNGGYGVGRFSATPWVLVSRNNAFGSGTQANTSGTFQSTASSRFEDGTITLPTDTTPWVDPANGDFRINLSDNEGTGRGAFLQTVGSAGTSTGGTVGYPDIGAAQHQDTGGSSGPVAQLKQFNRGTPY